MGITHILKTPKLSPQMWFIASDWHSKHLHTPSYKILILHALSMPLEHRNLIIDGDFLDTPYLMEKSPDFKHWRDRKDGVDEFFLPMWEEELKIGNDILDELQKVFVHIIFINGNHDNPRVDNYREKHCPHGYRHLFYINKGLKLDERNIGEVLYNDWLDFGKVSITHGMYCGTSAHKKHYDVCGARSNIFGHIHSSECKSFIVRGESRSSWSLPAMCSLNPIYMKNTENNWMNGYGTLFMRPDGNFNFSIHLVIDGKLLLPDGRIFEWKEK